MKKSVLTISKDRRAQSFDNTNLTHFMGMYRIRKVYGKYTS